MRQAALLAVVCVLVGSRYYAAGAPAAPPNLPALAQLALSDDEFIRSGAIESLRQAGPAGLDALFQAHRVTIARALAGKPNETPVDDPAWQRVRHDLDTVAGQRDCYTSHFYWYTDLDAAKAAARAQHKPILSLRLLGKLTDEYSCANSRFFRSALYTNAEVARALRERFVLHWQSVRPVPIITVDFGDGRKLQRTVTGNSVHYILDAEGQPLDALPGLYGPQAFQHSLERAEKLCASLRGLNDGQRRKELARFHQDRYVELGREWDADMKQLGFPNNPLPNLSDSDLSGGTPLAPSATLVGQGAITPQAPGTPKSAAAPQNGTSSVPAPAAVPIQDSRPSRNNDASWKAIAMLRSENPAVGMSQVQRLIRTEDDLWHAVAMLHAPDATLDATSKNLIARQTPPAALAGLRALTKRYVESPLNRLVRTFQQTIALDTVRNEYLMHRQIHQWLHGTPVTSLDALNERIYSELFLTPNSDPWLGLMPPDAYSAIEGAGMSQDLPSSAALTGAQKVQ